MILWCGAGVPAQFGPKSPQLPRRKACRFGAAGLAPRFWTPSPMCDGDIHMTDSTSVRAHQQPAMTKRGQIAVPVDHHNEDPHRRCKRSPDPARPDRRADMTGRSSNGCSIISARAPSRWLIKSMMPTASVMLIQNQGAAPDIPPKATGYGSPASASGSTRERDLIECGFSKLRHSRRVATRYEKLAANFLAMIQLASFRL